MSDPTKYYRKPGQPFRCGLTIAGRPCEHGPAGAACGQGNNNAEKCYPARTLAGWTRIVSRIGTLGAVAFLLIVVPSTRFQTTIAPGSLSTTHAQLLQSNLGSNDPHPTMTINSENRCKACHPVSGDEKTAPATTTGHLVTAKVGAQSQLCMKCHQQSMPNGFEGSPHDLIGEQLLALKTSSTTSIRKRQDDRITECSQCHREHRGSGEDLQNITSERCQTCHSQQFQSFSHGHPEFQNYPQAKHRSIAFDHGRHKDLYFQKKDTTFDCRTCHVNNSESGALGNVFRSVSYEQACAQCHDQPLRAATTEGMVVLQVPSLDRSKLKLVGFELGEWPESASQLMDGRLSPLLVELLRGRPDGYDLITKLPPSGKLRDIDLSDREQAKMVVRLAENVRAIFEQLASEGQPYIRKNLETQLSKLAIEVGNSQKLVSEKSVGVDSTSMATIKLESPRHSTMSSWLNQLSSGLPPDLARTARGRWFRKHEESPTPNQPPLARSTIRQPNNMVVSTPVLASNTMLQAQSEDLLASPKSATNGSTSDLDLLGGGDLLGSESLLAPSNKDSLDSPKTKTNKDKPVKPWEHLPFGGWMLDESRVAIVYVPNGHGDPWVARWIEWQQLSTDPLMNGTQEQNLAQNCTQCHTVSRDRVREMLQEKVTSVNNRFVSLGNSLDVKPTEQMNQCWKINQRHSAERTITKFSHTPHLTIPTLRDCQSCHVLYPQAAVATGTHGWSHSGMILHHEFQSMQIQHCSKCHTKQSAGEACTQCHNYHIHSYDGKARPLGEKQALQNLGPWLSR